MVRRLTVGTGHADHVTLGGCRRGCRTAGFILSSSAWVKSSYRRQRTAEHCHYHRREEQCHTHSNDGNFGLPVRTLCVRAFLAAGGTRMPVVGAVRQNSPGLCDPHRASVGFCTRFRESGCDSLWHDTIGCAAMVQILVMSSCRSALFSNDLQNQRCDRDRVGVLLDCPPLAL